MRPLLISLVSALMVFFGCLVWTVPAQAQDDEGGRFLDGIGETAIVARYVFDGNEKDSSRNNHHAILHGTAAVYVEDRQFGRVLSLPGESGGYVEIPGHVLEGYRARITSKGQNEEQGPLAPRIETNRWSHLVVVLDAAKQSLSTYANGVRVGRATNVTLNLEQVLDQDNAAANRLYIGKSQYHSDSDHVPLNPGSRKAFGNTNMDGFTCCNGTALESSTKLQDSIYFKSVDNKALYVNLYVPSTVTWPEHKVAVKQQTDFPYCGTTRLTLTGEGTFDIKVRVPRWATRGFFVTINGVQQTADSAAGTYLSLRRAWKDGDTIELRMPLGFRLSPIMDRPNIASIFYGPVLLAAEESASRTEWRPVTLNAADLGKSITGDPSTLRFNIGDVRLRPFFETYDRHSVYLDVTLE